MTTYAIISEPNCTERAYLAGVKKTCPSFRHACKLRFLACYQSQNEWESLPPLSAAYND